MKHDALEDPVLTYPHPTVPGSLTGSAAAASGSQANCSYSHRRTTTAAVVRTPLPVPQQAFQCTNLPTATWSHTISHKTPITPHLRGTSSNSNIRRLFVPVSSQGALPLYHSSSSSHHRTWSSCKQLLLSIPAKIPASDLYNRLYSMIAAAAGPALSFRAVAAGLLVGAVLCFSNMYFGLQTGWVTMGSLQSAILGYGVFQGLGAAKLITRHLTVAENVIVQTTAVATATMPLAAGLVGIIPALELLTPEEHPPTGSIKFSTWQLLGWCFSLAFFGVFVAVPLRYQTIIREKLRFPSGTATASVIRTLHGVEADNDTNGSSSRNSSCESITGLSSEAAAAGAAVFGQQQQQQWQKSDAAGAAGSAADRNADLEVAVDPNQTGNSSFSAGKKQHQQEQWGRALHLLLWVFAISGVYCLAAAWVKPLSVLPVFDWVGLPAVTAWGWVLQPSPGYIGQGMIMGPKTAWSMMAGAITGWGVLGPKAREWGWAPGPIKNIETGAAGWLMWLSLGVLLGDCFSELGLLLLQTAWQKAQHLPWVLRMFGGNAHHPLMGSSRPQYMQLEQDAEHGPGLGGRSDSVVELSPTGSATAINQLSEALNQDSTSFHHHQQQQQQLLPSAMAQNSDSSQAADLYRRDSAIAGDQRLSDRHDDVHVDVDHGSAHDSDSWLLSPKFWMPGLLLSTVMCTAILGPLLGMPLHEPLIAVLVALLVALLAVRALGQTDLNPVSGVGKISQLVFAVVSPGAVVPNLVAGAIAEAGAQQAGDLMQDFKTAHLLGVAPSSQLVAMLLGSAASVPLSVAAYKLYTSAWEVPGPVLQAPTAMIWLDMAKLVNGGKLPDHVGPFCAAAAAIAAALPVLQHILQRLQKQKQHAQRCIRAVTLDADAYLTRPKTSEDGAWQRADESCGAAAGGNYSDGQQRRRFKPVSAGGLGQAGFRLLHTWRSRSAVDWVLALLPSGVGFAVGMYLTPNWTVPRLIGSVVEQIWLLLSPSSHAAFMMVTASGLVLGEGCASVVTAALHAVLA